MVCQGGKMKKQAMAFVVLLIAAGFWFLQYPMSQQSIDAALLIDEEMPDIATLSADDIEHQQHEAAVAALVIINEPEIKKPLKRRPGFVSPVEWQILKSIAAEHVNSDAELVRMVNFLRFSKRLEWWQDNLGGGDTEKHNRIGLHLLDDIPERVRQQDMAPADAQHLQMVLLENLIADPDQRRYRMEQEAQRIGVTFQISDAIHNQ